MPLVDMPLEQLLTYTGRNPRPTDFDEFWDRALAEMRALDPQTELVPHPFKASYAECFDLFFTGVGGARVHAKLLRPKDAPALHPALVMFHGYGGNSGDWSGKLGYVAQGYSVAALDVRGQGGLSQDVGGTTGRTASGHFIRGVDDAPEKMLFRQVFLDCARLAGIVMDMPEVDAGRVGAVGGSQGGALTIACAALEPRIARAAPTFPFLSDYKRVWEMDLAAGAYQEIRDYFRTFDPRHEREDEVWTRLGYVDIQHLALRIKAEVLMPLGLMDTICPPSSQFAAYNKITSPKSLLLYPDFGHEDLPGPATPCSTFSPICNGGHAQE
jgi:cephalosporin-C deacetylase